MRSEVSAPSLARFSSGVAGNPPPIRLYSKRRPDVPHPAGCGMTLRIVIPNRLYGHDLFRIMPCSSLLAELAERFGQFRNRLIEVRDQAVIGNLENRRVFVLVDRNDHLGILHAGEMLDRAGDA